MGFLEHIDSPEDLKILNESDLPALCDEIRDFLVENVSKTGGHLASNLGAVELTVAVHRVFNTERDRLVFDVGHQSYVHKILTGRRDKFSTLRSFGGISGFPKPVESVHDAFIAGHASSSISDALGMARARTLKGEDYDVIALLGDGALTGGLAYEGLCDAGDSKEHIIIILNDNGMSITKNVGGMAKYLSHIRMRRGYISFKKKYQRFTSVIPGGKYLHNFTHRIKQAVKNSILHCSMFENMGLTYLGPVDGHDIPRMEQAFSLARDLDGPVLVHVKTQKGKGYYYAEVNPDAFHGVAPFDRESGFIAPSAETFASVFGDELMKIAKDNESVIAVTAAMTSGTGLTGFAENYPDRFFDVGIAEGHAAAMSAGAAHQGAIPVCAIYSTFLQRAYDMLIQDVGICREHVVFGVDKCGLVGEDGETHHGIFDVSYLLSVPGMTVLAPASFAELRQMLDMAVNTISGPVAIRYPKGGEEKYYTGGVQPSKLLRIGDDFTVVTYGTNVNAALDAADILMKEGISVDVLKLDFIKPIDFDAVEKSVRKTNRILVLEECVSSGCVGEHISAELLKKHIYPEKLILKNLGDRYITHGSVEILRKNYGLDADSVAEEIRSFFTQKGR